MGRMGARRNVAVALAVSLEQAALASEPSARLAASPVSSPASSGTRFAANGLGVELGGSGMFVSVNYERRLTPLLLVHAGVGYVGICGDVCDAIATAPLTFELLLGARGHHFDVGGGGVLTAGAGKPGIYPTGVVGYRYQRDQGGLFVRVAFTPIWFEKGPVPWGGVMVGQAF